METPQINLLDHGANPPVEVRKPARFFLSPIFLLAVFAVSFVAGRFGHSEAAAAAFAKLERIPLLGGFGRLIVSGDRELQGEAGDRINILLLGHGGDNHDGPNLTDTLILASIKPSEKKIALLSIPRDLIVPIEGYGWRKINAANAFGEQDQPGRGAEKTMAVLEGVLGLDIPYYVRIDFNGFTELVDALGGIDIHVDKTFTDTTYPTNDFGVQTIGFKEGWQTMDGKSALRFARSRHGTGGEGNDFARSKRQQKVLSALKEKLGAGKTYRNPARVFDLFGTLRTHVKTNFSFTDIVRLTKLAEKFDDPTILHKVLDNAPGSPLVDATFEGAYVLVPRARDWNELRGVAADIFGVADVAREEKRLPETRVAILNGTPKNGLAKETADALEKAGFVVGPVGNAENQEYTTTIAFDTRGGQTDAAARLREALGNVRFVQGDAAKRVEADYPDADFVIILGNDRTL